MLRTRNVSPTLQQKEYQELLRNNANELESLVVKLTAISGKCRKNKGKESIIGRIEILKQKIELEIKKYNESMKKCRIKTLGKGSIASLKSYFQSNFNSLVRQAHQILSLSDNRVKQATSDDIKKLKMYEDEMCGEWEQTNLFNSNQSRSIKPIDRNNLSKQASEQLHQQFLAIRMISYKMYEQYSEHTHPDLYKELKQTEQEQNKLQKQIQQAKLKRTELLAEQKKMEEELSELKKINELIGRRYFIDNSRTDTNFTT